MKLIFLAGEQFYGARGHSIHVNSEDNFLFLGQQYVATQTLRKMGNISFHQAGGTLLKFGLTL